MLAWLPILSPIKKTIKQIKRLRYPTIQTQSPSSKVLAFVQAARSCAFKHEFKQDTTDPQISPLIINQVNSLVQYIVGLTSEALQLLDKFPRRRKMATYGEKRRRGHSYYIFRPLNELSVVIQTINNFFSQQTANQLVNFQTFQMTANQLKCRNEVILSRLRRDC